MHKQLGPTFLLVTLLCAEARAQQIQGFDLNALPLPLSAQAGSALESGQAPQSGHYTWTLRSTGLDTPLSVRIPSPSPEGTTAQVVSAVLLSELSATVGLPQGWDAGIGFGAHLRQVGPQTDGAEQVITTFAGRDPRLGVGWSTMLGGWALRPFGQVFFPLGDQEALAGESSPRLKGGLGIRSPEATVQWRSEISFLYRPSIDISSSTLGPQAIWGNGVLVELFQGFSTSAEVIVLPFVSRQTSRSGDKGGTLIPAEAMGSFQYETGPWTVAFSGGTGLPLSRSSSVHSESQWVRGPGAPLFRGLVDLRFEN